MPITSNTIANQALQLVGDNNQKTVQGEAPTWDDSAAGKALRVLYDPVVAAVARQYEWDFARKSIALQLTGNPAPYPWSFEYAYPPNGIQVWNVIEDAPDPFFPIPNNFAIGNAVVLGQQVRVVYTNIANATAVYNNNPRPEVWDSLFREAVARLLGSALAMALAGKPDTALAYLNSGGAFENIGETRQN